MTAEHPNPFRAPEPGAPPPYAAPPVPGTPAAWPPPVPQAPPPPAYGSSPYAPYTAPGYGVPGGPPPWAPRSHNGLGTVALVLGIVSASLCWTFFLSPGTLAAGIAALVLARLALVRVRRGTATNRSSALAGLWTGLGGTVVSAVLTVLLVAWLGAATAVDSDAGSEWLAGPAERVTWSDGLSVTFDRPRAEVGGSADEGVLVLVANVTNDGEGTVDVADGDFAALADERRVAAGDVLRSAPRDTVRPGQTLRVRYEVTVPVATAVLGVDFAPGGDHDTGFWEFDVEIGAPADDDGGGGDLGGNPGDGDSLDV